MTTTIVPERLARLDTITLEAGSHESLEQGMCFIEFADWLAGGKGRDNAPTVSPVIRAYGIALNDAWDAEQRQKLRPYGPRVVGTAGDGQDEARSYLALDWLVRTHTPAWLDLAGLTTEAQALRDLRRIVDRVTTEAATLPINDAKTNVTAADSAAYSAARSAADSAAYSAADSAAGSAAYSAARSAAGSAARSAARSAADWAAYSAAGWAARSAAGWAAYWAARSAAGWAAGWAARSAAYLALKPTVTILQASALDLLDRLIDPSAVAL